MDSIAEAPTPEQFARFDAAMQKMTAALRTHADWALDSPEVQTHLAILAAQLEPLTPLLERMALTVEEEQRPYRCRRHHANLPAGCHCPMCIDDGSHNAGLLGNE